MENDYNAHPIRGKPKKKKRVGKKKEMKRKE